MALSRSQQSLQIQKELALLIHSIWLSRSSRVVIAAFPIKHKNKVLIVFQIKRKKIKVSAALLHQFPTQGS